MLSLFGRKRHRQIQIDNLKARADACVEAATNKQELAALARAGMERILQQAAEDKLK